MCIYTHMQTYLYIQIYTSLSKPRLQTFCMTLNVWNWPPKLLICSDLPQFRNNLISRNEVFFLQLHDSLVYYYIIYFIRRVTWCRMCLSIGAQVWMLLRDPLAKAEIASHGYLLLFWLRSATGVHLLISRACVTLQLDASVPLHILISRLCQSPGQSDRPLLWDMTPPWDTEMLSFMQPSEFGADVLVDAVTDVEGHGVPLQVAVELCPG